MGSDNSSHDDRDNGTYPLKRRHILQGAGVSGSILLAGCSSRDDDGNGNGNGSGNGNGDSQMGPAVETVRIAFPNDYKTSLQEPQVPIIGEALEALGIEWEGKPGGVSQIVGDGLRDKRTHELAMWIYTPTPDRLDPREFLTRQTIDGAGANCTGSFNSYTSCEYSTDVLRSDQATSPQERRDFVTEAFVQSAEDAAVIGGLNHPRFGALNTNTVDPSNIGNAGIAIENVNFVVNSSPIDADSIRFNADPGMAVPNPYQTTVPPVRIVWFHMVNSPLLEYDENFELGLSLAESWEVSDDGTEYTFELEPDAEFHNGDQVTAEDVKFTYEHIYANPDVYPKAQDIPLESVETDGDTTVRFQFSRPYPPFTVVDVRRWGIFHKRSFEESGKADDPANTNLDEFIGSGPWEVNDLNEGQFLSLVPSGTHPRHDPDHNLILEVFQGAQAAFQSFNQGSIDVFLSIPPNFYHRLEGESNVQREAVNGWTNIILVPQHSFPPFQYKEIRMAVGMALNRQKLNQVAFRGEASMQNHGVPVAKSHPFFDEDEIPVFTDDMTGDVEGARQLLSDAGYTWDDDGNLYYPSGTNVSPRWPEGEGPDPADYDCLEADCELVLPDSS
jgi:peptide/nickel transport system substrate-binding protein